MVEVDGVGILVCWAPHVGGVGDLVFCAPYDISVFFLARTQVRWKLEDLGLL